MNEDKDIQLLREYVRESMISEGILDPGHGARALRLKPTDKVRKGIKATKQRGGELWASLKNLFKGTVAGAAEFLTAGAFEANYDKIRKQYVDELQKIRGKYGNAADEWDKTFYKEKISPLVQLAWFVNAPVAAGVTAAAKAGPKIAKKAEQLAATSGVSEDAKKAINKYYMDVDEQIKAASVAASQKSIKGNEKNTNAAISNLKTVETKLTQDAMGMKKALGSDNPVYQKHVETLKNLKDVLASLGSK